MIKPHSSCPTSALDLRPTWAKQTPSLTNSGSSGKGEFPTLSTSSQGICNTQKLQSMFSDFTNVSTHQHIAYFLDCFALIHQLALFLLTPITRITLVLSQISEHSDKRRGCWPPVDNAAQTALAFTPPLMPFALRHSVLNLEGLGIWRFGAAVRNWPHASSEARMYPYPATPPSHSSSQFESAVGLIIAASLLGVRRNSVRPDFPNILIYPVGSGENVDYLNNRITRF